MTMTEEHFTTQPRDHKAPCSICKRDTWNVSGLCDAHDEAIPRASAAPSPAAPTMAPVTSSTSSPAPAASTKVLPSTIRIAPLDDPMLVARGHHVRDVYVESFWLPVLGPSAVWLLRHASFHIERSGQYVVEPEVLGKRLGLAGVGRNSPLLRTLDRLVGFHAAVKDGDGAWRFRLHLGDLPRRHLARLDEELRSAHAAYLAGYLPATS